MSAASKAHLMARLRLLRETVPSAARRRTPRGLMRTCRQMTEHIARIRQLYAYADNAADEQTIDDLISYVERLRDELAETGTLAQKVREDRADRQIRRRTARASHLQGGL